MITFKVHINIISKSRSTINHMYNQNTEGTKRKPISL